MVDHSICVQQLSTISQCNYSGKSYSSLLSRLRLLSVSLSLSLSLSTHTHTHTVVHSRLQKKISYMWASEVDPASILVGNGGDCWFSRNDAYVAFAMLVSAAVDCLLEDFPSITPACCMCKVLPTRFIANWVAKVTFHYVRVDLRYESLEWLFRWNKKLRIAVGVLML